MMAAWMIYAFAMGAGLGLAGLLAERLLRLLGRPQRWAWAASMAASLSLPVVLPVWSALSAPVAIPAIGAPVGVAAAAAPIPLSSGVELAVLVEPLLVWGWLVASLAGVLLLLAAALSLKRRRRKWEPVTIDGLPVLISRRTGPAVVGLLRCTIVLPEWVLEWPAEQRRLIVAHEREHTRAHDPLLLGAALLALAVVPWNLALWWQARRLQLAVELDCDRRVLGSAPDVAPYGMLLLEVGRRASGRWVPLPAFSEPASFLERRIRGMTAGRPRFPLLQATALGLLLLALPIALHAAPVVNHPSLARLGGWLGSSAAAPAAEPTIVLPTTTTFGRGGAHVVFFTEPSQTADPRNPPMPAPQSAARALSRAAACVVASCQLDRPVSPGTMSRPQSLVATMAAPLQDTVGFAYELSVLDRQPSLANVREIQGIMGGLYPPLIKQAGVGGTVQSQFVIEADGTVGKGSIKVLESPNEQLSRATAQAITEFRFNPGLYHGNPVPVLIQMPITWQPDDAPFPPAGSDRVVPVR